LSIAREKAKKNYRFSREKQITVSCLQCQSAQVMFGETSNANLFARLAPSTLASLSNTMGSQALLLKSNWTQAITLFVEETVSVAAEFICMPAPALMICSRRMAGSGCFECFNSM